MSQNTCLELAEAPEGDGCKNNARKVSNKKTGNSTNVLRIRNCSTHSEPMMSHAPGGLAGSWQMLLQRQQRMVGRTSSLPT